ncbi:MFS transporter [Pseudoclavibacter chungangensis]|uniref:Putative proline/betaine transporter n=1 Tax=Pseudoclavibacter chungangensis TaxID=587635 RepID=A0A7J5BQF6_9MICO|nr:MFS transporter [Pseudoclavibacter chungangensis]KAB1656026.1 MFS transporter [Pseudoclavibacter chungangensis]NYJ66484.1 MHS family alpha-ketoglutarate permease-like MFS transporter [Pseudoclavibacter chungangensis]
MTTARTEAPHVADVDKRLQRKSLLAMSVGNTLEWYDWTVYTVASVYIAAALFESGDPLSALLQTLAVFAIGFLARPLGGIVFGRIADRRGRRAVLITTMLLMAAGSVVIGLTPSFEAIGPLASLLLLVARLIQGFAHGGESTTSYAYIAEIAPPRRRGLWSSAVFVAVGTGSLIATGFLAALTAALDTDAMNEWGWRVPFLIGGALAVVALFLRRGMVESADHATTDDPEASTVTQATWSSRKIVVEGIRLFFVEAGATVTYYTWVTSAAVYAIGIVGMHPADAFMMSAIAQVVYVLALPLLGHLSDIFGRRALVLVSLVGIAVTVFPLWGLITTEPWTLLVAQGIGLLLVGCITGSKPAAISEQIPNRYRTRVFGVSISLGVALFGGTASYLSTWLYGIGLGWVFNVYVIVLALVASAIVLTWRRNTGVPLSEVV